MKKLRVLAILPFLLLGACAQNAMRIGTDLEVCCPGEYSSYSDYRLEVIDMPLFLRGYAVTEFEQAFQAKGLARNNQAADLRVVLSYNHINLDAAQEDIDPFARVEAMTIQLRYIAEIEIEMFDVRTDEVVWAGAISRIHQVTPGEHMHEDEARVAFRQAFRAVLASYPALDPEVS